MPTTVDTLAEWELAELDKMFQAEPAPDTTTATAPDNLFKFRAEVFSNGLCIGTVDSWACQKGNKFYPTEEVRVVAKRPGTPDYVQCYFYDLNAWCVNGPPNTTAVMARAGDGVILQWVGAIADLP